MTGDCESPSQASLLTSPGRGAVSVVAARGRRAEIAVDRHFRAANGRMLKRQAADRIYFGRWTGGGGLEEEVVLVRDGDGNVEVHCHGGDAAASRIMAAFQDAGCRCVAWSAWASGERRSAVECEAIEALAKSLTFRTAGVLLDQYHGALNNALNRLCGAINQGRWNDAAASVQELMERATFGAHLTRPWRITIAGFPNVGKSSLMNALIGYSRSIVFDQPGTTRDVLTAETAIDGWPVRLVDVAGARRSSDAIETAGVELAKRQIAKSDLLVWVLDASALSPKQLTELEETANFQLDQALEGEWARGERMVVVNKSDLLPNADRFDFQRAAAVSAKHGRGIEGLQATISRRLVPTLPSRGAAVPFTSRQTKLLRDSLDALEQRQDSIAINAIDRLANG